MTNVLAHTLAIPAYDTSFYKEYTQFYEGFTSFYEK